jgi:hypothetical protein
MHDKALGTFLMVLFGSGGIVVLVLAWTRPLPLPDRILTTFVGSAGLVWTSIRALSFMFVRTKTNLGTDLPQAEVKKSRYNRC